MNIDILVVLARLHVDEILRGARRRRLLVRARSRIGWRAAASRALRAVGWAAVSLGDALAEPS